MATVIADGLAVCVECALVIECGGFDDVRDRTPEEVAEAQVTVWGDDARWLVMTDYETPFFSHYPCEGCGCADAGDRMIAAVVR